uniref:APC membrane recruitment protein 1-like n=1 Tax=Gouania willdenowi TaxID=441366 RepID=A0A8C5ET57_GOUWI
MASCKRNEPPSDTQNSPPSAEHSGCGSNEVHEELDPETTTTGKFQKPGKFRSALTFFGVRKNICILPNFFGGRRKNQKSSKKGIIKSRTHDGLSKLGHDDCLREDFVSAGDNCHNECRRPATEQKSLTLGRQRKGFRSLFNSFRHHRNNRNGDLDKTEMSAMSSAQCKNDVPVVRDNTDLHVTECLESEPDVPSLTDGNSELSFQKGDTVTKTEKNVVKYSLKSDFDGQGCEDLVDEIDLLPLVVSEDKRTCEGHSDVCLTLQTVSEPLLKSEIPDGSSEQINQIFEDVASLKSFDSLTGCGDIIADQEDDSITESTVSGERSRNGGKRASCYLTYQGGGEEMASPEDFDETSLNDFWGNIAAEEIGCPCNQEETEMTATLSTSHNMDLKSSSAQQASGIDTSSMTDVLSPQSEHQESVPNSDEGYYDATTPGLEEGQEKTDRLKTNTLPRDSYSGDALYELFAPDESLISPRYESKSKRLASNLCNFSREPVGKTNSAFAPESNRAELFPGQDFLEMQSPTSLEMVKNDLSFCSTPEPDFETFDDPEEEHIEENGPMALQYRSYSCQPDDCNTDPDDGLTVCFSQALVDYTKHTEMLSNLNNSEDLETNSAITPNMEALPAIVTFDVVDMHNEGEYDEQIQMELDEDISSPYQEFDESYLQKDAFAEYHMFNPCEQNLDNNTWAVASLPRHLGLMSGSQSMPNPLSLDRRSRSLEAEGLTSKMPDLYRENKVAIFSCAQTVTDPEQDSPSFLKKNVVMSAAEVSDGDSFMALPWLTRSEMALSLPLSDGDVTKELLNIHQTQVTHKRLSGSASSDIPNTNSNFQCLCSNTLDLESDELFNTQCQLPLQLEPALPHHAFLSSGMMKGFSDDIENNVFCKASSSSESYNHCGKSRGPTSREGMLHTESSQMEGVYESERSILSETRQGSDGVLPTANNSLPK